jgi:uncharacterized membrane protein
MSRRTTTQTDDRILAGTLRLGAYLSFALIVTGLLAQAAGSGHAAALITRAGILLLMATPVMRIAAACIVFLRERDRKYALISLAVLTIVVLTSIFALGER